MFNLPLKDLLVLEFGQNLSAPLAGLRLADMGARVIKIELSGDDFISSSSKDKNPQHNNIFHHQAVNRNKESLLIDLSSAEDKKLLQNIIAEAHVLLHNLPEQSMEENELDYYSVTKLNPGLVAGCISGYGNNAHWHQLPDIDSLLQSISGLAFTTGNHTDHPIPFGTAIADKLCSAQLVQGILAGMIRKQKTGKGALVEISLLGSLLDFQFELLTTYYSCGQVPVRSNVNNGHSLLSAPYGIYATANGFIAIAMVDLHKLGKAIGCNEILSFTSEDAFQHRDEIKTILSQHLKTSTTQYWLSRMHEEDLWTMEVLSWQQLVAHPAYKCLEMEQTVGNERLAFTTTRSPLRFGGRKIFSSKPAPRAGEHNAIIKEQLA